MLKYVSSQTVRDSSLQDMDVANKSRAQEISPKEDTFPSSETEQTSTSGSKHKPDTVEISAEARVIAQLEARDSEVKAHEAAHAAVGGRYAGAPSLTYTRGPDGKAYATGGEVSIDVQPVAGDPEATLDKAQVIRAAALAPAQPSAQDLRVAAKATRMSSVAQAELAHQKSEEADLDQEIDGLSSKDASSETEVVGSRVQLIPQAQETSFGFRKVSLLRPKTAVP